MPCSSGGRGGTGKYPRGWLAQEDHDRVLMAAIWAGGLSLGLEWPAFLEGGAVLRITDAEANVWLPRALRTALSQRRYRPRNPPPPQPQPQRKQRRR